MSDFRFGSFVARIRGSAERSFVGSAGVAQSVEQLIRNEKVGCSIHLSGTKQKALIRKSQGFFLGLERSRNRPTASQAPRP